MFKNTDMPTFIEYCKHYTHKNYFQLKQNNLITDEVSIFDLKQTDQTRRSKGTGKIRTTEYYIIKCPYCNSLKWQEENNA